MDKPTMGNGRIVIWVHN